MEDGVEDVKRKIKKAYCPPQIVAGNPIIDYAKNIVLAYYNYLDVNINGIEMIKYTNCVDLETDFVSGRIHPGDLKAAVTDGINRILEPVRLHFSVGEPKKLLEKIKSFKVTR